MHLLSRGVAMKLWWKFVRYQLSVDLYLARIGGNKELAIDTACRIADVDRQLDLLEINHE